MKKFPIIAILITFLILIGGVFVFSNKDQKQTNNSGIKTADIQNNSIRYEFYWGVGCPHCAKEEEFLEKMENKYSIKFQKFEIYNSLQNQQRMLQIGKDLSIDIQGVPFVLIENTPFIGFLSEETTGKEIEAAITTTLSQQKKIVSKNEKQVPATAINSEHTKENINTISLPIFGKIDIKKYSLPVLTILIAAIDGFNPCAMWTLILLIGLLMGMHDKKRMWLLGTLFIVTSGFVYFLFLTAWLNLFLFLSFTSWIKIIIGIIALCAGLYYLKDFTINKDAECKVTGTEKKKYIMEKMQKIVSKKQLLFAIIGIIVLAFAVNLIELVCSAGLPAIYTQILSISDLSKSSYYLYLLLYIFIFILDDLLIFISAMLTLKITGLQTKYSRLSHLVGGIIMLIVGILLLVKPELLMFG